MAKHAETQHKLAVQSAKVCEKLSGTVQISDQRRAHAEPHQVVGGRAARVHANTTILDYVKMLPEIMHQSLDFGPFSACGSIGALC